MASHGFDERQAAEQFFEETHESREGGQGVVEQDASPSAKVQAAV
jgi:hypothetical protein